MENLTKIAEGYLGCDRDYKPGKSLHQEILFFKDKNGILSFQYRYVVKDWLGIEEESFSAHELYLDRMTEQEIIDHPNWANCESLEELAVSSGK